MFWFLDAGNDETLGRLSWPASKNQNKLGHEQSGCLPQIDQYC